MLEFIFRIFGKKQRIQLPAGRRNLLNGMIVRPDGWTRDSRNLWFNKVAIREYRSGFSA